MNVVPAVEPELDAGVAAAAGGAEVAADLEVDKFDALTRPLGPSPRLKGTNPCRIPTKKTEQPAGIPIPAISLGGASAPEKRTRTS